MKYGILKAALAAWFAAGLLSGCGSSRPTDPDKLAPFVQWVSPGVASGILEYSSDTLTVEFSAADDGGVISRVTVYLQGAPVVTLTAAPFRHTLDLSSLGHNRPGRVYATAADPTGKIGSTADTLTFMVRPQDTVSWNQLTPVSQPDARVGHTLSLDASGQRAILFGGQSFVTFELLDDTWAFDFAGDTWTPLVSVDPPPARKDHGAGVLNGTFIVFGGQSQRGDTDVVLQDYALLDLASLAWATNLYSVFLQPLRSMPSATMNSRLYTYGGSHDSDVTYAATDSSLRVFDLFDTTWSESPAHASGPRMRVDALLLADQEAARLIVYGGASGSSAPPTDASHYRFGLVSDSWSSTPQLPQLVPPVTRAAAVCDSVNNRLLLWGGIDNAGMTPTDVWEFSLGSLRWRKLVTLGTVPAGRTEHEMVIDQSRSRVIMFGGRVAGLGVAETWELSW